MRKIIVLLLVMATLIGCDNKQREMELLEKIENLESQLDECQNAAEKIHAKMKLSYEQKDFPSCKNLYREMEQKHPDSKLFAEVKSIYEKIVKDEKEKAEKERLLADKKDREAKLKAEKEKQLKLKALKKLKKKYDDVADITWYRNPYFTHYTNRNLTSVYIGHSGMSTWLRLRMSYHGDDWIFFEKAYLSYGGSTKEIFFNKYDDKKTDNGDGGVWEWIDVSVSSDTARFLREFAKSKKSKMRLSGKYTRTRNLTWNERQGIIDVLNGYDLLKQGID
ncbi:MAG: hypothetical protein JRE28_00005 [Deltaproteobacteria bacterium]|nr:hypothetical protein [Deltaproteobacteria bacterium]